MRYFWVSLRSTGLLLRPLSGPLLDLGALPQFPTSFEKLDKLTQDTKIKDIRSARAMPRGNSSASKVTDPHQKRFPAGKFSKNEISSP